MVDPNTLVLSKKVFDKLVDHPAIVERVKYSQLCLLYTSDAADERSSVALGGRRIIKKKTNENI